MSPTFDLICRQIDSFERHSGKTYNVGGGLALSVSLAELTVLCAARTGDRMELGSDPTTRPADIPYYITDNSAVSQATDWAPTRTVEAILDEVFEWLVRHRAQVEPVLR